MLNPVYLFWRDERKTLLKIVDFEYPNASLLPELRDPDSNDQFVFWIARMGDPIYNDEISGSQNISRLVQRLGFHPSPLGAEFKHIFNQR